MTRQINFYISAQIGQLTLLQRVRPNKKLSPGLRKRWRCRCSCGNIVIVPEMYMKRDAHPKRDCGCVAKAKNNTLAARHPDMYSIWYMMNYRCQNPKHDHYKNYGGRGISVCKAWHVDTPGAFEQFVKDVGIRPSPSHSIDRIDNDGNYTPTNVKWSTAREQAANTRLTNPTRRPTQ